MRRLWLLAMLVLLLIVPEMAYAWDLPAESWRATLYEDEWYTYKGNALAVDASGNTYVVGKARNYGSVTDTLIVKYDDQGIQRASSVGMYAGEFTGVTVGDDGYIYAVGLSDGQMLVVKYDSDLAEEWTLGPYLAGSGLTQTMKRVIYQNGYVYAVGVVKHPSQSNYDYFLAKVYTYDDPQAASGFPKQSGQFNYRNNNTLSFDFGLDLYDNIFLSGTIKEADGYYSDFKITKLDPDGSVLNTYTFGAADKYEEVYALDLDITGNVYVTGRGPSQVDAYKSVFHTISLDNQLGLRWGPAITQFTVVWEDFEYDYGSTAYYVEAQADGSTVVGGECFGEEDAAVFMAKYDAAGAELWKQTFWPTASENWGASPAGAMTGDNAGNTYVAGYEIGPSDTDFLVQRFSPAGDLDWSIAEGGSGLYGAKAVDAVLDTDGNLHVVINDTTNYVSSPLYDYFGDIITIKYATGSAGPMATGMEVSPAATAVAVADTTSLTATATYSDETTADVTASAAWSSSDEAVATVEGGVVTGVSPGTVTITATFEDQSATAEVTVNPTEVWVDDAYSEADAGDHAWGLDAFDNLTDAVNAVAPGGTVHVYAGTYVENVVASTDGLTIENAGEETVAVQATSSASPTITLNGENIAVSGLTIQGGSVGIQVNAAGGTITGNTILDNTTGLELNAAATVTGNMVTKNNTANIVVAGGVTVDTADNTRGPVLNDYPIADMLANTDETTPEVNLIYDTSGNVNLDGSSYVVFEGDEIFKATIRVTNIDSLGFGSVVLDFDPAALQVDQVTSLLPVDDVSVTENTYDNPGGSINFSFALQSGAANLAGSGENQIIDLAEITFSATGFDNQDNLREVRFSYDDLETRLTRKGETTTERLDFTLPKLDDLTIIERVDIDGSAGITFKDWLKHKEGFTVDLARNGETAGSVTTTVNSTAYAFSNLVEGSYTLTASGPGYRTSTQAVTVTKTVAQAAQDNPQVLQITDLIAGDVVIAGEGIELGSDGFISTEDFARVAAHYREAVEWATATEELKSCDLDRDGKVTIDDIAYVIMNWFEPIF